MDSSHTYDSQPATRQERLRAWRALPRLLVSRQWRWLTLGVLLIAFGLIRLGFWQLNRLEQRHIWNALVASRIEAQPLPITGQPLDVAANEYRRVVVTGEYDPAQEIVLRNRAYQGTAGADVLTPLHISGSDQYVLIDRGWIPLFQSDQATRKQFAAPQGRVTVEGVLRKPQQRVGRFSPLDPQPKSGRLDAWLRPDIARIATQMPYPLLPLYIEQLPSPTATLPRPQLNVDYTNPGPHLSYAVQWFSFALIGLCGYAALVVTRTEQLRHATTNK